MNIDLKRGAVTIIGDIKPNMKIKFGIDPTSPDLHLGHVVILKKLRDFALMGHTIDLIIGDFTATIGDPTGRNKTRPWLTPAEIDKNHENIFRSLFWFFSDPIWCEETKSFNNIAGDIEMGPNDIVDKVKFHRNSTWLGDVTAARMIEAMSIFTVAQMIERNDFATRFTEQTPIGLHEFVYPVLQGLDSVNVDADLEIGGTDQLFNMMAGRKIMEKKLSKREPQAVMTMPILIGTDGVNKMSKTLNNHIAVHEAKSRIVSKVINIPDNLISDWFTLLTNVPATEVNELLKNPRLAKERLAHEICILLHKEHDPNVVFETELKPLWQVVRDFCKISGSEARRLIQQGGVRFDGNKIVKEEWIIQTGTLKVGKHDAVEVVII